MVSYPSPRELPFIPLKQVVAHELMLDLAAGVIWRNLELVVPPPLHFAGDAALVQPPDLVDDSDDEEMLELVPRHGELSLTSIIPGAGCQ